MSLLSDWRDKAYNAEMNQQQSSLFWAAYFGDEKGIYEQLLAEPDIEVCGTVKELAEKYDISMDHMVGFLDGINDSLITPNPIDDMTEDTVVSLAFDKEKLYYNMCEAKAEWLYTLPQWDGIFSEEKRKEIFLKQRKSNTVIAEKKVGRNDPCPCGSGKKYKFCCGRK